MGQAKKELMDNEEHIQIALSLCAQVGAISECDDHDGEYIDNGEFSDYEELTKHIIDNVEDALSGFDNEEHLKQCVEAAMQVAGVQCSLGD